MQRFWIINLVIFQASWFCAAFLNQHAGPLMAGLLVVHFLLSPTKKKDLNLLLLLPVGLAADKLQLHLGVFSVGSEFFPMWLLLIWIMFIISLNHSLSWLNRFSSLPLAVIGALGGTASYWGGIKAGVIEPLLPAHQVILSLMLVWAILMPTFVLLRRKIERPTCEPVTG
ncbi:DUF2878 domain-containing protein [Vibrio genomosp. F10]|uniref:DUF2878 domain-containing protein n=1 Tax=Vibrio genomosp. F10 TaxID=723171 RepID=UPI0002DDCDF9|nr:DUF2878 domain-containing protein [Vibrio genomosp. F10]OEF08473.1 hypothetical protein A1QI_04190 [Vibrio genomosp. F10 str. 9ZB36]